MKNMVLDVSRDATDRETAVHGNRRKRGRALIVAAVTFIGGTSAFLASNYAGARGGRNPEVGMLDPEAASGGFSGAPSVDPSSAPARIERRAPSLGLAVCVRLCDGSFFPSNASSGGDATCNAQCPDAPSALYREPVGSDSIEAAISTTGAPYTALPAAERYRSVVDETCTCHRHSVNYAKMVLQDPTLRKGDMVMTPKGLVVYQGSKTSAVHWEDFVALAQAPPAPSNIRGDLYKLRSSEVAQWDVVSDTQASIVVPNPNKTHWRGRANREGRRLH